MGWFDIIICVGLRFKNKSREEIIAAIRTLPLKKNDNFTVESLRRLEIRGIDNPSDYSEDDIDHDDITDSSEYTCAHDPRKPCKCITFENLEYSDYELELPKYKTFMAGFRGNSLRDMDIGDDERVDNYRGHLEFCHGKFDRIYPNYRQYNILQALSIQLNVPFQISYSFRERGSWADINIDYKNPVEEKEDLVVSIAPSIIEEK